MFVVTANVIYCPDGPSLPSFLYFNESKDNFEWYDEGAEFFSYQDAWAFVEDLIRGKRKVIGKYIEVKDIEIKGVEFKKVVSVKRNKDYGEMEMLMKSNN